jgi:hypothetical protein
MSNPLRKIYETDTKVEKEGVIVEYAPGIEIRIARAGGANKKFAKVMTRLARPHRRAIQTNSISEEILTNMFITAYAQTIVLDWKGFTKDLITHDDADAEIELDFNQENVEAVLHAQPNLFKDIQETADNIAVFRAEILESDSGN